MDIVRFCALLFVLIEPFFSISNPDSIQLNHDKQNEVICRAYYQQAVKHYNKNFDSVLYYSKKALGCKVKEDKEKARFYLICGVAYKNIGKPDSSIFAYNAAIKIFKSLGDFKGIASAKNNLGLVYTEIGDYEKATNAFIESVDLFKKIGDTLNIAEVYLNLGELNVKINNESNALNYFKLARKNYRLVNSSLGEAFVLSGMGDLKDKNNELDSALYFYKKSALAWKNVNRLKEYAIECLKIGSVYDKKGQLRNAIDYYNISANNFSKVNYLYGLAQSYVSLAKIYLKRNEFALASKFSRDALRLSKVINSRSTQAQAYKCLYLIEKSKSNFDSSLVYFERYGQLKDSLLNESINKNIADIQAKYQLLVNQRQIESLRDSTRISKLIIEKSKLEKIQQERLKWVLIAGVVISIVFILLIYYRYKTKKQLSTKLFNALTEREILLKELHHRVKNNLQIISSLLNLQSEKTKNAEAKDVLNVSKDRIMSMVMIHEKLYRSENFKSINLRDYVNELVENLSFSTDLDKKKIKVEVEIEKIILDINKLIPCGLIINELLTNSVKHAFKGREEGIILIEGKSLNGKCILSVSDNGVGLPDGYNPDNSKSLGLRLITGLIKQINGVFEIEKPAIGSKFLITFEI
jgi:two-component sensor histidine kinase/Tfp pilus assembly protein PilF